MEPKKPFWIPDTQGLLAFAIVTIISFVVVMLLVKEDLILNEKTHGALLTLLGVLLGCFKDVYSFFFGSSAGSAKKDETILVNAQASGTGPGTMPALIATAEAAEAAAPAAAAAAAPPAAEVAVPPAIDAELDRRGVPDPDKPKDQP